MNSEKQIQRLDEEKSPSTRLSKDMAEHLLKLMKDVSKDSSDPRAIAAACACAKQLHNILRLEFEVKKWMGK